MNKKNLFLYFITILYFLFGNHIESIDASTYYISPSGSDNNAGTIPTQPLRTFSKSMSLLKAGDTLTLATGTYSDQLNINISGAVNNPIIITATPHSAIIDGQKNRVPVNITGSYITLTNLKVVNSNWAGVNIKGNNIIIDNFQINNCQSHAINAAGTNIIVRNSSISSNVLENQARNMSSGWGSGLKVSPPGNQIIFEKNQVFHNYGEGIATTMGQNITIRENRVYDNLSVNIYSDKSDTVQIERNFVTCDPSNNNFTINNKMPVGIAIAEEDYTYSSSFDAWRNMHSKNILVANNISAFCRDGIAYWSAYELGGLDNYTIINNTLWGASSYPLSIYTTQSDSLTRNSTIANNIFQGAKNSLWWADNNKYTGINFHHNYWVNTTPTSSTHMLGSNDIISSSPLLSQPNYNVTSYQLSPTSSAINAGGAVNLAVDYYNNSRPLGSEFDIGAHEYSGSGNSSPIPTTSPSNTVIAGDLNLDGKVNIFDYNLLIAKFGNPYTIFDYNNIVANFAK